MSHRRKKQKDQEILEAENTIAPVMVPAYPISEWPGRKIVFERFS